MRLKPVGKDYLWGGTRLREEFGKDIALTPLAETWECSTHPDGPSTVANGSERGRRLVDVLAEHPEYLGTKVTDGQLPVLVKFIDARQDLSVQVHPDDAYARQHEHQNGKTEMWYVVDAAPGATLIHGFRHPVTADILRHAIATGTLERHLRRVPVRRGDTFFVPAGVVHGIGAGTLIAEIQESSNVTYRVYDYDRRDKDGHRRALHFDRAMDVLNCQAQTERLHRPRMVRYYDGCSRERLCRCRYFDVERIRSTRGFTFSVLESSFQIVMILSGEGRIETMDRAAAKPTRFRRGDTLFLPAGIGRCVLIGDAELLKIRC